MKSHAQGAVLAALLVVPGSLFASPNRASNSAVAFYDGRLILHFAEELEYSPGHDYNGMSGLPTCEEVTTVVPSGDNVAIVYVIAAFPRGQNPELGKVTFAVQYDAELLEIIDTGINATVVKQTTNWPRAGSSIHLSWDPKPRGRSVEVMWFAVRQLTETPALLALGAGAFGGEFGDDGRDWPIDGFGTVGFGRDGDAHCPFHGFCCLPGDDCELLTELWCDLGRGVFIGDDDSCASCAHIGACCHDWTCKMNTESQCVVGGWVYAGDGTACEPNACIPFGACCAFDGTCTVVQEDQCDRLNFVLGATCDPSPCPALGACCYTYDELCIIASEQACLAYRSEYQGDGTICSPESCLPGLCCVEEDPGACLYSTPEDCAKAGGSYREGPWGPPDEACSVCFCCPATIESSWGTVKSRFRERTR